jgi:hypothetical protein
VTASSIRAGGGRTLVKGQSGRPHSPAYVAAVCSPHWQTLKAKMLAARAGSCRRCGHAPHLELHHRHYRTLGRERREDVELVCEKCHEGADVERERDTRRRAWSARVEGRANAWGFSDLGAAEENLRAYLEEGC